MFEYGNKQGPNIPKDQISYWIFQALVGQNATGIEDGVFWYLDPMRKSKLTKLTRLIYSPTGLEGRCELIDARATHGLKSIIHRMRTKYSNK